MKTNLTKIANYPVPLRLGIFIIILLIVWLPVAIPVYFLFKNDPNLTTIVTMAILYLEFVGLLFIWNKKVYNVNFWWRDYGLTFTRKNGVELLNGLSLGLIFTFGLFFVEAILGWVKFVPPSTNFTRIIFEGLLSALGIGLAEELFFRGWLLEELKKDYSRTIFVVTNGLIFAILHFLKPIEEVIRTFPQFPALFLLGVTLVWAKIGHSNRLGICIGLHGGLVWAYYIINVGNIVDYTGQVSTLVTGIDNNPLAGIMGLIGLGLLSLLMSIGDNLRK
ncbi:CPBP family intramembrane glutamic endopeptidase [Crocosphaera sp. Alani8]|uniref:CPBP family intramembrane glutamic endopeptidase n=1 Tax=Crocosphaera sp. Alani8 TaxID=3038952 RepID=UPI00313DE104